LQRFLGTLKATDLLNQIFPFFRYSENEWTKALVKKFNDLTALQIGWDGYGGRPVSFTCASFAANLLERLFDEALPPPSLVPGSDGTVQFEWHINQYDVEVDVLGAFRVIATRHDNVTGTSEELEFESDFTGLAGWISEMTEDRSHQLAAVAG
jgi:hypothetical protein